MPSASAQLYLKLLGGKPERPSLDALTRLVRAQLERFPYENVSKLLQAGRDSREFVEIDEYLAANREYGFGGTCYAQNVHFRALVSELGYETELIRASVDDASGHHVNCRVRLTQGSYIVDFGFGDPFAGPFDEAGPEIERMLGGRRFRYIPKADGHYRIEIHRDAGLQRAFESEGLIEDVASLHPIVRESFRPETLFMKSLIIGRRSGDPVHTIWNRDLFSSRGDTFRKTELASAAELERVVHEELRLPRFPIRRALEILEESGHPLFER